MRGGARRIRRFRPTWSGEVSPVRAILLCAGKGTRFRPVTDAIPKPLLPFLNVPVAAAHLERLQEAGIGHMFGVPGDFNLELLQHMEDGGYLKWVGTCNEMNASYAANSGSSEPARAIPMR